MMNIVTRALLLSAAVVTAVPTSKLESRQLHNTTLVEPWDAGAVNEYFIHESCNSTQAAQIADGLKEAVELAEHAKKHILRWGNSSELYQKYFGNDPPYTAIGSYDVVVNGDKTGIIFRCDNPDGNCAQEGKCAPCSSPYMLTAMRLGRSLEGIQRDNGDCHLRPFV
jgi:hypothetical protein